MGKIVSVKLTEFKCFTHLIRLKTHLSFLKHELNWIEWILLIMYKNDVVWIPIVCLT
jgi:hypothetical protein